MISRDFLAAVRDIELAILQVWARAARAANGEALKLYFYVTRLFFEAWRPYFEIRSLAMNKMVLSHLRAAVSVCGSRGLAGSRFSRPCCRGCLNTNALRSHLNWA